MRKLLNLILVLGLFIVAGAALTPPAPPNSQSFRTEPNGNLAFFYENKWVEIVPAVEDYLYFVEDICDAMELDFSKDCAYPVLNGNIKNILAVIDEAGWPIIIYDRRLSSIIGDGGATFFLAHELGHIYCGHLYKYYPYHLKENQADRFAGAAMRKLGETLPATLSYLSILSVESTVTHPAKVDRIKAIMEGWNNPETGTSCRQ